MDRLSSSTADTRPSSDSDTMAASADALETVRCAAAAASGEPACSSAMAAAPLGCLWR